MEFILTVLDFIDKVFNLVLADIDYLRWEAYLVLFFIFFIPFLISRYFKAIIFRFVCVLIGITFLSQWTQVAILRDYNFLIGMGLISPHVKYFFNYIKHILLSILGFFIALYLQLKYATINSYYFFLTIYYKILRFINWIKNILFAIKILFTGKRKEKEENSYSDNSDNNSYEESSYDHKYRHKNSYNHSQSNNYSKQDNSYQEEDKSSYTKNESSPYEEKIGNNVLDEFKQFYSSSSYIVLGVSTEDNIKTIKKKYRVLIRIYHPDINQDNIVLCTEISQNINNAYGKLKKIHGE